MWQDIVISFVGLLFGFMMIPQLMDIVKTKTPINLWSSGLTAIGLFILGITFYTLNLWISVCAEFFVCGMWSVIWIYSYKYKNRRLIC